MTKKDSLKNNTRVPFWTKFFQLGSTFDTSKIIPKNIPQPNLSKIGHDDRELYLYNKNSKFTQQLPKFSQKLRMRKNKNEITSHISTVFQ